MKEIEAELDLDAWNIFGIEVPEVLGLLLFSWLVAITIVLIIQFVSIWIVKRAIRRWPHFDGNALWKTRKALLLVFWFTLLSNLALELLAYSSDKNLDPRLENGAEAIGTAIDGWFFMCLVDILIAFFVSPSRRKLAWDKTSAQIVGRILKLFVGVVTCLMILDIYQVSLSGVLAFGGVGGITVGFAAKDLLANFFGGLMIHLDRQFVVGDWIRSPDKEIEGTVEDIGWRVTCIRTFDMRPLYVPNSTFTSISVENPSRMSNRRFYETFGLRYQDQDKVGAITDAIREMLLAHPEIDTRQTLMVNLNTFNSHSVDFFVYTFTKTTRWALFHQIKQDLLDRIAVIVAAHGAEFAFPTRSLHIAPWATPVLDQSDKISERE